MSLRSWKDKSRDPIFNAVFGLDLISRLLRQSSIDAIFMQDGDGIPRMMQYHTSQAEYLI